MRWRLVALGLSGLMLVALASGGLWMRDRLLSSLPILDGRIFLEGLAAPVTVDRDDHGVPTIRGESRSDVARALGFVHAQDRFFQMDMLRRTGSGELAALFGPPLVEVDRMLRVHRFRSLATQSLARAEPSSRAILDAYAAGVNAGLASLRAAPPEYIALGLEPEPWQAKDVALVVLAMYFQLQGGTGWHESINGIVHDLLPGEVAQFLTRKGTPWDAPLVGDAAPEPAIPEVSRFDLRRPDPPAASRTDRSPSEPAPVRGSNNWAIAGWRTEHGGALVANDMHLGLQIPNTWYRASLAWPDAADASAEHRVTGLTLPGVPFVIAGSNGHVAWGFTNTQGDTSDLVILEVDPEDRTHYRSPEGPRRMEVFDERIEVRGGNHESLAVQWTLWGPVIDEDHRGRPRAHRWVAHDHDATSLGLMEMERSRDVDEALRIAARTDIPAQNVVVGDRTGRIGWTVMGPLPRRFGHDGRRPRSWASGEAGWLGRLEPDDYPRVLDPASGAVWTANNRVVESDGSEAIGDGGFVLGARAGQIRDGLLSLQDATPRDLLEIQLDDRALLLTRWRDLLLATLGEDAVTASPARAELRRVVQNGWTGRASIDSTAYPIVRAFRMAVRDAVLAPIVAPCMHADERFEIEGLRQWEGSVWQLLERRPAHMLDAQYETWEALLLGVIDTALLGLGTDRPTSPPRTWGDQNTIRIQHRFSLALPFLSRWLDPPPEPLAGDLDMPLVQSATLGASERFVVSPGREAEGIFHMPGGQSGHFLSPYYLEGHRAWADGEPTPFLPSAGVHRLELLPPR